MALANNPGAVPSAPTRIAPTPHPLLHPEPMLVPVIDACALLIMGCDMIKRDRGLDLVTQLSITGRGNPHIAAHIPGEIRRHLLRIARHNDVPPIEVARVLDQAILPSARLVELEIRDHLAPGTRQILRVDCDLPRDNRGDPDDVPTMALAEFLAPAVIITQDSVFTRFGFAGAVAEWIPIAKDLLRMVGIEANLTDAAFLTELALRLLAGTARELVHQAVRHPWLTTAVLAAALWICHRRGSCAVGAGAKAPPASGSWRSPCWRSPPPRWSTSTASATRSSWSRLRPIRFPNSSRRATSPAVDAP